MTYPRIQALHIPPEAKCSYIDTLLQIYDLSHKARILAESVDEPTACIESLIKACKECAQDITERYLKETE